MAGSKRQVLIEAKVDSRKAEANLKQLKTQGVLSAKAIAIGFMGAQLALGALSKL